MSTISTISATHNTHHQFNITTIAGKLDAKDLRFALVASRFNDFIVKQLIDGAIDCLLRHGAQKENLTLVQVPGAFEIALATQTLAQTQQFDAIICLGAIIRGATPHFELLAHETSKSLAQINLASCIPIGWGILTTDTLEQAIERAGTKGGNKGSEAAAASLEMVHVMQQLLLHHDHHSRAKA
jgi:6,7-dimethyl-8-ribityllumazine synthase